MLKRNFGGGSVMVWVTFSAQKLMAQFQTTCCKMQQKKNKKL